MVLLFIAGEILSNGCKNYELHKSPGAGSSEKQCWLTLGAGGASQLLCLGPGSWKELFYSEALKCQK